MTTDEETITKTALLAALRKSGRELPKRLAEIPAEKYEEGRYESGWNGRQILAHVASIEWTYPRLLDLARTAAAPPPPKTPAKDEPKATASRPVRGGILSYNDRQVEKRADASVAELITEFKKNREATIAAIQAADDELFATPISSAGGIEGTLGNVINAIAVIHVLGHVNDIAGEGG